MKFLIPEDEFGVFADQRGVPRVDSLFVAATFEKQHYNVLRDIGRITASNSGLSPEFIAPILRAIHIVMPGEENCHVTC